MEKTIKLTLTAIGNVRKSGDRRIIAVDPAYRDGLRGLDGFGHLIVVWWADKVAEWRTAVEMEMSLPYAPQTRAGLFATRSPLRPNPICISTCRIEGIDVQNGAIEVDELDAVDETAVLDIKPYYGTLDRVEDYTQPDWVPEDWPVWRIPIPEENYGLDD